MPWYVSGDRGLTTLEGVRPRETTRLASLPVAIRGGMFYNVVSGCGDKDFILRSSRQVILPPHFCGVRMTCKNFKVKMYAKQERKFAG